jgi:hypothetical protein
MVGWIMTFAWPFVKDLSAKVIIGGVVKKDSKVKWIGLLATSTKAKSVAFHNQAAEETAIFHTHPNLL